MAHVFVSYVQDNLEAVERLRDYLVKHGVDIWLDRYSLKPGERWRPAIQRAIRDGAYFIACFSNEYTARDRTYMNEELTLAIQELRIRSADRAWFIPVLLSGSAIPERHIGGGETLRDIQWVDLTRDWEDGVRRLLLTVGTVQVSGAVDEVTATRTAAGVRTHHAGWNASIDKESQVSEQSSRALVNDLTGFQVLILDDRQDVRESFRRHLTERGMQVLTASDVETAKNLITSSAPDVLLADLRVTNVTEMITWLRVANMSIPTVAYSAYAERPEDLYRAGFRYFLTNDDVVSSDGLASILGRISELTLSN